jgi:hypothetical protein
MSCPSHPPSFTSIFLNLKRKRPLGDESVAEKTISKFILEKQSVRIWNGLGCW